MNFSASLPPQELGNLVAAGALKTFRETLRVELENVAREAIQRVLDATAASLKESIVHVHKDLMHDQLIIDVRFGERTGTTRR